MEGLDLCILAGIWVLDGRSLALRNGLGNSFGVYLFGELGNRVACVGIAHGGKAAREDGWPYGCGAMVSEVQLSVVEGSYPCVL